MTLTRPTKISKYLCRVEAGDSFYINNGEHRFDVIHPWSIADIEILDKNMKIKVKDENDDFYWIYFNRNDQSLCIIVTDYGGEVNPPLGKVQSITPNPTITIRTNFTH